MLVHRGFLCRIFVLLIGSFLFPGGRGDPGTGPGKLHSGEPVSCLGSGGLQYL
uniref:Uncharacterized protein n=1 Tax=Brassica oleracea var. oleracea TaxID=109376 RepID=A0A0D3BVA1_BRAOL